MKKILFSILLAIASITYCDNWVTDWSNNGNGWIGGWHIGTNDEYISGSFIHGNYNNNINTDLFCINGPGGWAGVMYYSSNGWTFAWNNGGNGLIGYLPINNPDYTYNYYSYFNGFSSFLMLFAFNDNGCHLSAATWNNGNFITMYESQNNRINGWIIRNDDRRIVGNFDNTGSSDELMLINPANGWAYLCRFNSSSFTDLWMNGGSGTLPGWILRTTDRYFSADVDGDETDELICLSPYNGWSAIFKYTNGSWTCIWANGSGIFGGWGLTSTSRFAGFDFDNDNNEEIFNVDWYNGWCTVKNYDGATYWPDSWTNYGSHWINGWYIQSSDYYTFGNYANSAKTSRKYFMPIERGTGWAAMMWLTPTLNRNKEIPASYQLKQNYPNPFNPTTTIEYDLPIDGDVKISIFNILGNEIAVIVNKYQTAGSYSVNFDASGLSSGTYFYKLTASGYTDTKKLTVIK